MEALLPLRWLLPISIMVALYNVGLTFTRKVAERASKRYSMAWRATRERAFICRLHVRFGGTYQLSNCPYWAHIKILLSCVNSGVTTFVWETSCKICCNRLVLSCIRDMFLVSHNPARKTVCAEHRRGTEHLWGNRAYAATTNSLMYVLIFPFFLRTCIFKLTRNRTAQRLNLDVYFEIFVYKETEIKLG